MVTLITNLNEGSARDLFFELLLLLLLLLLLFPLNIISKNYQSAYHDGKLTQQAVPPVNSVTLLESMTVDNNLDGVFDQTWAPLTISATEAGLLICLTTDCATQTDFDNCISNVKIIHLRENSISAYRTT